MLTARHNRLNCVRAHSGARFQCVVAYWRTAAPSSLASTHLISTYVVVRISAAVFRSYESRTKQRVHFDGSTMNVKELRANAERCGRLARGCNDESIASQFRSLAKEFLARARELGGMAVPRQPATQRSQKN